MIKRSIVNKRDRHEEMNGRGDLQIRSFLRSNTYLHNSLCTILRKISNRATGCRSHGIWRIKIVSNDLGSRNVDKNLKNTIVWATHSLFYYY